MPGPVTPPTPPGPLPPPPKPTDDELQRVREWNTYRKQQRVMERFAALGDPGNVQPGKRAVFYNVPLDATWPPEALVGLVYHLLAKTSGALKKRLEDVLADETDTP